MEAKAVLEKSQVFAVIGLSDQPEKYSYKIYQCLKALGKEVYGISKRLKMLEGKVVYASLKDMPCGCYAERKTQNDDWVIRKR